MPFIKTKLRKNTDPIPKNDRLIKTDIQPKKHQWFSFDQNEELIRWESYWLKQDLIETPRSKQEFCNFQNLFSEMQTETPDLIIWKVLKNIFDYP